MKYRSGPVPLPTPIPTTIRGYMWAKELVWLYERAKEVGPPFLEVGSYRGLSASAIGQAGDLTCVDTFQGGEDLLVESGYAEFAVNMKAMGLHPHVIIGNSLTVLPHLYQDAQRFNFIFIDGGHIFHGAYADLRNAQRLLNVGGILVADDYFGFPGVRKACELVGGFEPVSVEWSKMAWKRKE